MPFEAANVIRRAELAGAVSADSAALAHGDLLGLPVDPWADERVAAIAWAMRFNVTVYDAAYVAIATVLDAPLSTRDRRLAGAPGFRAGSTTPVDGRRRTFILPV